MCNLLPFWHSNDPLSWGCLKDQDQMYLCIRSCTSKQATWLHSELKDFHYTQRTPHHCSPPMSKDIQMHNICLRWGGFTIHDGSIGKDLVNIGQLFSFVLRHATGFGVLSSLVLITFQTAFAQLRIAFERRTELLETKEKNGLKRGEDGLKVGAQGKGIKA